MSDGNLFEKISSKNNFLWSHSIQSFEKFIRKKQLIPFIKYRPQMILEGSYHLKTRSLITSFFGKNVLKIAPDDDFIKTKIDTNIIPEPNAIFTTKSDRNLDFLLEAWHQIKKISIKSKLFINPPYTLTETNIKDHIFLREKGDKKLLINDLINSKVFITPGHKTEVFCLAAEEARELCIPIVTMGYGCLYERVEHNKTGFIAKDKKEFIDYTSQILNDNEIYLEFKKNLILKKNSRNYNDVKNDLIKILKLYD
jgi:glycosyltransferase involved in cell wall biosynthesis